MESKVKLELLILFCSNCNSTLLRWIKGEESLAFGVPTVWREPRDHTPTECYFCAVKTVGVTSKNKYLIKYPNLCRNSSAGVWRIFSETLDPVSVFKESFYDTSTPDVDVNMELGFDSADPALSSSWHSVKFNPEVFNQKELNDLILDINVSEENSKLLASRTQGKTFLALAQK